MNRKTYNCIIMHICRAVGMLSFYESMEITNSLLDARDTKSTRIERHIIVISCSHESRKKILY